MDVPRGGNDEPAQVQCLLMVQDQQSVIKTLGPRGKTVVETSQQTELENDRLQA